MQQVTKVISFGLIHNQDDDTYLISQRYEPEVPWAHLKRDLIWWQHEFGESLEQTCIREIKEETWIDVSIVQMLPWSYSQVWNLKDKDMQVLVFCFLCNIVGWECIVDDPKICDHKRINKDELLHYDFLPSIRYFVTTFADLI